MGWKGSKKMKNQELARVFERIADLLEIDGADTFRVNSYRRVSRTLKDAVEDIEELAAEKRLNELPGIGKASAQRIVLYLTTGHIDVLDELEAKFPPGLSKLLEIPGLGPKKVALVHKMLGVASTDDLQRVIASGELEKLPGLGAASVKKIADGMAFLQSSGGRTPLGEAIPIAESFLARVKSIPGVRRAEIAGSLRRGSETIGDIDILCDARDPEAAIKAFIKFEGVKRMLAAGTTKGSVTIDLIDGRELQIDLRAIEEKSFGAAWQYFTGSKEHNVRLRERAVSNGWRLNEYGLHEGEKLLAGQREEDIYKKLGLPWIPPELREGRGEFDEAVAAEELVSLDDLRGDLHMHTVASDGRCTIEEMAEAAKKLGYEYIAICDHSKSSTIANGLSIERMKEHIAAIRDVAKRTKGIAVLVGCECDILPDGSLDYPNDILEQCDWVVASIHSAMGPGESHKKSPTERTLSAMRNPFVSAIGHPTGRLINKRAPMDLDLSAVIEAANETATFLEVNASWQRLDLKDLHVRQAIAAGVTLVIDTDAHHSDQLAWMRFGVMTARRGGAKKKNVLNCLTPAALRKRIAQKRKDHSAE